MFYKPHYHGLPARLLYGTRMRLMELIKMRTKDVDLDQHRLTVREAKNGKDRQTVMLDALLTALKNQMLGTRVLSEHIRTR
jgi:integrase